MENPNTIQYILVSCMSESFQTPRLDILLSKEVKKSFTFNSDFELRIKKLSLSLIKENGLVVVTSKR